MDKQLIEYLSSLAKLKLSEEEKELYATQMHNIFKWVEQISELNLSSEKDYSLKYGKFIRDDDPRNFPDRDEILKNFTDREFDFLKVKKVIDTSA